MTSIVQEAAILLIQLAPAGAGAHLWLQALERLAQTHAEASGPGWLRLICLLLCSVRSISNGADAKQR